jgi:Holliday junction resolvasome RuvABC ATP-dependent DNA helicase subunit
MGVQRMLVFSCMNESQIRERLDPKNPQCPFHTYIGNSQAVEEAMDLAYSAFGIIEPSEDGKSLVNARACPKRIALLGPPSVGKTYFARKFSQVLDLPYAETDATQLSKVEKLFEALASAYEGRGIPIQVIKQEGQFSYYRCPPGILFIDEVHLLSGRMQDAMLKMCEANDGRLILSDKIIDCSKLCIIIATTDKGKLRGAFKTRFTKLQLIPHTTEERSQIIKLNNPHWSEANCLAVAQIQPIPRESLDFADSVNLLVKRRHGTIKSAIKEVANRRGVSDNGMSLSALSVLKLLHSAGPSGLSRKAICSTLRIEDEEFVSDCLPYLVGTDLHPPYMIISNKHYITPEGVKQVNEQTV